MTYVGVYVRMCVYVHMYVCMYIGCTFILLLCILFEVYAG